MGAKMKERKILNISSEKCRRTIAIMRRMDASEPEEESLGSKLSAGKPWTQFAFYKDALYTLEMRGEKLKNNT